MKRLYDHEGNYNELYTLDEVRKILQRYESAKQAESRYYAKQKLAGAILFMMAAFIFTIFPDALIECFVVSLIGVGLIVTKDKVLTIAGWEVNLHG